MFFGEKYLTSQDMFCYIKYMIKQNYEKFKDINIFKKILL